MPVVKGGVWTNIEDEVLKAAISKYGLNQWARVSSLLARKTPKQCKARWSEWLDPGIRKVEWSREEDERLLHLAKLMPTQWRTIAPIVGRTATQCLERYQKLLDEAEARENDELGLGGPAGGETAAPSADDVRRLRPGELDPDPESKPARPDTIDMDEDEKEMLSEARARLANTQGKKAKRKARERQLEESRRLALLQKRRELKNAGINTKITYKKKGQMDYNADIPFEKKPMAGFYDTTEEIERNERQRKAFDPRKQQLANKRKPEEEDGQDRKKKKTDNKPDGPSAAAVRAAQLQKIRDAERSNSRRSLNLPAPQVSEGELEDIVKMGLVGERATQLANQTDNDATRGIVGNYSAVQQTPIRTPRAPPQEDRVANEIKNIRAMTETQSSLLGGENAELYEGPGSTGFEGATPRGHVSATPNPMATLARHGSGSMATPRGPGATPRDGFNLNRAQGMQLISQTPQNLRLQERMTRSELKSKLASLPKPKETDWELELPEEQQENIAAEATEEDAAERDRRLAIIEAARKEAEFRRRTKVMQKGLPRPTVLDVNFLYDMAAKTDDPINRLVEEEVVNLLVNDMRKYPLSNAKITGSARPLREISEDDLNRARLEVIQELPSDVMDAKLAEMDKVWEAYDKKSILPGLAGYDDESDEHQLLKDTFENLQERIVALAEKNNAVEKKLAMHLGGYRKRADMLKQKIAEADDALRKAEVSLDSFRTLQIAEQGAIPSRLETLRAEVAFVARREREAQEEYRRRKEELESLKDMRTNGTHHVHSK